MENKWSKAQMEKLIVLVKDYECIYVDSNETEMQKKISPVAKRPKKSITEVQRRFHHFSKDTQNQDEKKFDWLGSLVTSRMEAVPTELQEEAAWEIQCVLHKYISSNKNRKQR